MTAYSSHSHSLPHAGFTLSLASVLQAITGLTKTSLPAATLLQPPQPSPHQPEPEVAPAVPQPTDAGVQGVTSSALPAQLQPGVAKQAAADATMAEIAVQPESSLAVLPDTVPSAMPVPFAPSAVGAAQPAAKGARSKLRCIALQHTSFLVSSPHLS